MPCYICDSEHFVDDHHYDCCEGKLSPETVPLCRRCHRTYHGLGVGWFEDEYLDKAIEIENKRREIHRANSHKAEARPKPAMTREDITRSNYFNKVHGITKQKKKGIKQDSQQEGEQLCFDLFPGN